MKKLRIFVASLMLLASSAAFAQMTDGIIVRVGDSEQQFAITDIRDITFGDGGISVVRTDDVIVEFAAKWQITFAQIDGSGIAFVTFPGDDAQAQIYNVDGVLLKEVPYSDININEMPKGVYIIMCNGKSIKVTR